MEYFEKAQRYEMMSEVAKLLQPFYEDARDSKAHIYTHCDYVACACEMLCLVYNIVKLAQHVM